MFHTVDNTIIYLSKWKESKGQRERERECYITNLMGCTISIRQLSA